MSFEIKYDRDGQVIIPAEKKIELAQQPQPIEITEVEEQILQSEDDRIEREVQEEPIEEIIEPKKVKAPRGDSDTNLMRMREKADRLERERNEYERRLQDLEARFTQQSNNNQQVEEDYTNNIGSDDLVEGKHLSKVEKKIKKLEDQIKSYQQQSTTQTTEARLKAQYPDFDRIVSKDNIESLKENYPEIAHTLNSSTDLYSTAVSAYTLIKKLGISQDTSYDNEKILAQRNAAKPKPLASLSPQQGDSPMSKANAFANGLTEDLKAQLYREMNDAIKRMQ
jgi:uncharacterized phage infection (PIP) family protein YhgE